MVEGRADSNVEAASDEGEAEGFAGLLGDLDADAAEDAFTPFEDDAAGLLDLFEAAPRDLLIAGSYANYAAVLDQHIVVSYPGGGHDVLDKKLNKAPESVLQPDISRRILTQLSRFYR